MLICSSDSPEQRCIRSDEGLQRYTIFKNFIFHVSGTLRHCTPPSAQARGRHLPTTEALRHKLSSPTSACAPTHLPKRGIPTTIGQRTEQYCYRGATYTDRSAEHYWSPLTSLVLHLPSLGARHMTDPKDDVPMALTSVPQVWSSYSP